VQDWPTLFFHFIESRRAVPFAWGRHDCCLFACDGILSQTGLDPAAGLYRGKYRDALGAARLVRKHGGVEAIAAKVCAAWGWPELATARLAQRGDVVLMDINDGMKCALGLVVGGEAAFPGPEGLLMYPLRECRRAWAIARPVAAAHLRPCSPRARRNA
jgi:hypothetical protein